MVKMLGAPVYMMMPMVRPKMSTVQIKRQIPDAMGLPSTKPTRCYGPTIHHLRSDQRHPGSCSRLVTATMGEGKVPAMVETLGASLAHLEDVISLVWQKMATAHIERQIPAGSHWRFCYTILMTKVARLYGPAIHQLRPDLRHVMCILFLVLRAVDTVEDDVSIPADVRVSILHSFHRHLYDPWLLSCGTKKYRVLMDKFHLVSKAFLELDISYQEIIEDVAKKFAAGTAKFLCKEVETVEDYDEYCHYVSGYVPLRLSQFFRASRLEDLASDSLPNSMGLFLQKTNVIRDYLEDVNEVPKKRMTWPRQIWSKYADNIEDFKYEQNSKKAVECLNDMVTNALMHVEDSLEYMSTLRDPGILRYYALLSIVGFANLALCYNNSEVFRGVVKIRRGQTAQIIEQTRNMSDVYCAFFDFACMLKAKVDKNDPNATLTLERVEAIQTMCINSGDLIRRARYVDDGKQRFKSLQITIVFLLLSIMFAILLKRW